MTVAQSRMNRVLSDIERSKAELDLFAKEIKWDAEHGYPGGMERSETAHMQVERITEDLEINYGRLILWTMDHETLIKRCQKRWATKGAK